jgi:succinate dehydrogenase / fumarate reductase membrane anchor subunit
MVKKEVVGAHYGIRDWLMQRITAVIMLVYTVLLIVFMLQASQGGYANWQRLFSYTWVKVVTSVTFIALLIHAWVGIRDVWMDYIQHLGLRLTMHALTIVWLVASLIYSFQVVWGR